MVHFGVGVHKAFDIARYTIAIYNIHEHTVFSGEERMEGIAATIPSANPVAHGGLIGSQHGWGCALGSVPESAILT